MRFQELNFDEFVKTFKSLKRNKTAGFDDLSSNITIDVYDSLKMSYFMFSRSQFKKEYFLTA